MKNLKRIGAIILALVMVLGMSTMVFAAEAGPNPITDEGKIGTEQESLNPVKYQVTLVKELKIYNTEGKEIYLPRVSFNYSITPYTVENSQTVTDEHNHVGTVYTGVGSPTITSPVVFAPAGEDSNYVTVGGANIEALPQPAIAAVTGTSVYKGITVDFSTVGFEHAGIYRYQITETEGADYTASGVEEQSEQDYNNYRYLDVYVRMIDTDNDGVYDAPEIYGYVCYINGADDTITSENEESYGKNPGFIGETGGHKYDTYNIEVTKKVAGNLGEKNHEFPITVKIINSSEVTGALLNAADSTGTWIDGVETGGTNPYATFANDNIVKEGLSDDEKIVLYGIPTISGAMFDITDLNDTYDIYTADVKNNEEKVIQVAVGDSTNYSDAVALAKDQYAHSKPIETGDQKITVTNLLTEVSPTGVVMRFAPYALILAGGVALLVIALKRRSRKDDDD